MDNPEVHISIQKLFKLVKGYRTELDIGDDNERFVKLSILDDGFWEIYDTYSGDQYKTGDGARSLAEFIESGDPIV